MSLLKYIERMKRMDDLIGRKATGCATEFAQKLGISPSQLFQDLKEMKELGAPIQFCPIRRTYYYEKKGQLTVDFVTEAHSLKGGENFFPNLSFTPILPEWSLLI